MSSPRGAAVVTSATLPEGGYIGVFDDTGGLLGINPVALGRGSFKRMMIGITDPGPGSHSVSAKLFKTAGHKRFSPAVFEAPYAIEPAVGIVTL